jgi:hypothetical protein
MKVEELTYADMGQYAGLKWPLAHEGCSPELFERAERFLNGPIQLAVQEDRKHTEATGKDKEEFNSICAEIDKWRKSQVPVPA